jgi:hypothetical protein
MSKKIIAACMALAAFAAFAVMPAVSSASPVLTHPTGTKYCANGGSLGEPCTVTATNIGITKFNASGLVVECSKDLLTGKITKNNGTEIEGTIETASFKGAEPEELCKSNLGATKVTTTVGNGVPWCVKAETNAAKEDILTVRGNSCANAARSITFAFDIGSLECKYERTTATGPIVGTYTTDTTGDAVGTIGAAGSGTVREGTNFLCPATGTLEMSFTLETDTSASADPMYIS